VVTGEDLQIHWNFNDTNVLDDNTTLDVLAVNVGK
jgi:hypothetical protein